jgi:6-phosphogluconolactonase (cycloisomerase 2 family)
LPITFAIYLSSNPRIVRVEGKERCVMRNRRGAGIRLGHTLFALALLLAALAPGAAAAAPARPDAVYTLANAAGGNAVAIFDRAADGTLAPAGEVATGGLGTGGGLGSQGALVLRENGRHLYAVNAGSDEISVFETRGGLRLVDKVASGGEMPISLTVHGKLLYVLNAGGSGNIAGFKIGHDGMLKPLEDSTRPLSNGGSGPAPGPAQVQFSADGKLLVVTEKMTNLIDTYTVGDNGRAHGPTVQDSAGETPFGFAFDKRNHLIVSEAFGGAPGLSALSSYATDMDGDLDVISASVPTNQTAACWVVVSKNGRYAYTTNTGSDNISGYSIAADGELTLLGDGNAAPTGDAPTDMDISRDGRYLYALNSASGDISAFRVEGDGGLTPIGTFGNLPAGVVGLAAS